MPGLFRKLLIFAASEGVVLAQREPRGPTVPVCVAYKDNKIGTVLKDTLDDDNPPAAKSFEAFGIIGILTVSKSSFLISITRRQPVAQIQGKTIYVVTEVALTPLSSRVAAEASIANTRASLLKKSEDDDSSYSDTEEAAVDEIDDEVEQTTPVGVSSEHQRSNSVAEDVITRKGGYGRFAQKWFSRKGWTVDQRRNLGMSTAESTAVSPEINQTVQIPVPDGDTSISQPDAAPAVTKEGPEASDVASSLLPKLLRTTSILFGSSQSFYFSYDWDITRSFATRSSSKSDAPDPLYFWNRNLIQPFADSGQTQFVLPLMQGFIGQRLFEMDPDPPIVLESAQVSSMELVELPKTDDPETQPSQNPSAASKSQKAFLLTLISRRSVKRAGLRYLRRGVNEEGETANTVETEQILSDPSWDSSKKVHSFVQIRGSIPIFFSQSPYSFKPIPQLQHPEETNYNAFAKHFELLSNKYGDIQIASLVEKHGPEAIVGDAYQKYYTRMHESEHSPAVSAEFWDFHRMCKGMKFENVSLLMDLLAKRLDSFGDTVQQNGQMTRKQSGILRTNCMDCLDRTNVVQSACGRRTLELQLKDEGIDMSIQVDQTTQWFNELWADNGDALSKAYASTAALKGDFTRTRKRDLQGALKDMGLSISRFYSGIVNDYFSQAAIDFLLGNVNTSVWEDFEANLMTGDPAVSMPKLRQQAIEMCQKIVVADEHEEFIGGWTLLTPQVPNTIKSTPFEESVLLLTDAALYSCRFDWVTEKVSSFERVDLQHISSVKYGTYITSTLSPAQADEERNVGFVITYQPGANDITRVNSRAMSNIRPRAESGREGADLLAGAAPFLGLAGKPSQLTTQVLALKALSTKTAVVDGSVENITEVQQIKTICAEIERMVLLGQVLEVGAERKSILEQGDIISLADARRSTGILEQLSHSLKKLVWA